MNAPESDLARVAREVVHKERPEDNICLRATVRPESCATKEAGLDDAQMVQQKAKLALQSTQQGSVSGTPGGHSYFTIWKGLIRLQARQGARVVHRASGPRATKRHHI